MSRNLVEGFNPDRLLAFHCGTAVVQGRSAGRGQDRAEDGELGDVDNGLARSRAQTAVICLPVAIGSRLL